MSQKLKIGVIGAGWVSDYYHLPSYNAVQDLEIVGLCDINAERAREMADKHCVEKIYTDLDEMLEKEQPDIASVLVPSFLHEEVSKKVAKHGVNILIEKPMGNSLAECDNIIQAAEDANVKLAVAENFRYLAENVIAKQHIQKGLIGDPFFIRFEEYLSYIDTSYRGSREKLLVLEMDCHYAEAVRWLADSEVKTVHCITRHIDNQDVPYENFALITIEFENGVVGVIEDNWAASRARNTFSRGRIDGTHGTIFMNWDIPYKTKIEIFSEKEDTKGWIIPEFPESQYDEYQSDMVVPWAQTNMRGGTKRAIEDIMESIRNDTPPPISGKEFKKTMEIVYAAYESAEKGQVIKLR